jgi:hypothetical protein
MSRTPLVAGTLAALLLAAVFGAGVLVGANRYGKPKSVIQLVTIKWAADATPEQREAVLQGVERMAGEIPGVRNVWLRPLHLEPRDFTAAFAIEFQDQAAADRFAKHPLHEAWSKTSLLVREEMRSQQLTN